MSFGQLGDLAVECAQVETELPQPPRGPHALFEAFDLVGECADGAPGSAGPRSSGPASCRPAMNGLPGKQRTSSAPGRQAAAPEAGAPPLERAAGGGKEAGRAFPEHPATDTGEGSLTPNRAFASTLGAQRGISAPKTGEKAPFGAFPMVWGLPRPPGGPGCRAAPGAPFAEGGMKKTLGRWRIYRIPQWNARGRVSRARRRAGALKAGK